MKRAEVDYDQIRQDEPFFEAVHRGDLGEIKQMVADGASVNARNLADCTVLELAGNIDRVDIMRFFKKEGATVRTKNSHDNVTFSLPVKEGDSDVLQFYIKHGVDLNATDPLKSSALHWVITGSNTDKAIATLELLKKHRGLEHLNHGDYEGMTPLMNAIMHNEKKVCEWFLNEGADIKVKNRIDEDAIAFAKRLQRFDFVTMLSNWAEAHDIEVQHHELTDDDIDKLADTDEKKRRFLHKNKDLIKILLREEVTLDELASADMIKIQKVLDRMDDLDGILAVATIKQILGLDPTQVSIPDTFTSKLRSVFGSTSGMSCGGDKESLLFRSHGQNTSVFQRGESLYQSAWIFAKDDLLTRLDKMAQSISQQEHYVNRWVKLPADCVNPARFGFEQRSYEWPYKTFDMQVVNVYYSPDTKQVVCEQTSSGFPYENLTKKHASGLDHNPYYYEKHMNEMVECNEYSYDTLRQVPGMSHEKLLILTDNLRVTRELCDTLPLEELVKMDSTRLHYLIKHYERCVKPALELLTLPELGGLQCQTHTTQPRLFEGGLFDRPGAYYLDGICAALNKCTVL